MNNDTAFAEASNEHNMYCAVIKWPDHHWGDDLVFFLIVFFYQGLFEQVLATTDFNMFYALMAKRNIMIQEQVLAMILAANGVLPSSLRRDAPTTTVIIESRGARASPSASRVAADDRQEEELMKMIME